ncbi:MAG: hypothetical protein CMO12_01470, partial [Thaumarchaeota archaeon]|nr:hypothetical protein [Nitrososphaerota archaeon]
MAVPKAVRTILDELVGDPKYTGECPSCTESFKLRDAGLFYLDNLSPEAESARQSRENGIQELAAQYKKKIDRIEKGAPKTSLAVNVGKVVEKVAPTLEGFPYPPNDCRFLAEPIDYLIFNGI